MKTLVQFVLIGWLSAAGSSQARAGREADWNKGKLELVFDGELNYNWKAEIVQLRLPNGMVKAYSAFQVSRFLYFDNEHNALRTFASVDFPVKPTLDRRLFLEEYVNGPMTIYRRLRHQHESIRVANPSQSGADNLVYDNLDSFVYYVFCGESMIELDQFDHTLWPRMKAEFGVRLNQYKASKHLDTGSTPDRLLLIARYNALKSEHLAASAPAEVFIDNQE